MTRVRQTSQASSLVQAHSLCPILEVNTCLGTMGTFGMGEKVLKSERHAQIYIYRCVCVSGQE